MASAEHGAKIGDLIAEKYLVTGVVGKGGMGAVYAAEHTATGQKVALKFMTVQSEEDEEFAARFEQEARVMAKLRNPHTIRIYDFGRTAGNSAFMAMELLEGVPLDLHIKQLRSRGRSMGEHDVARIGVQVLRSLGEAHTLGLVHRDLKPGNVFITDDGGGELLAKVLDFGIARVQDSSMTSTGKLIGTPAYMAPEQWRAGRIDGRTDIYAVGGLLHCCAAGSPPFVSDGNPMALMYKHLEEPVPDPRLLASEALSDEFVEVLQIALAKHPDDRFADAKAMRLALEAVLSGQPRPALEASQRRSPPAARAPSSSALRIAKDNITAEDATHAATVAAARRPTRGSQLGADATQTGAGPAAFQLTDAASALPAPRRPLLWLGAALAVAVAAAAVWWGLAAAPQSAPTAPPTITAAKPAEPAAVAAPAPSQAPPPPPAVAASPQAEAVDAAALPPDAAGVAAEAADATAAPEPPPAPPRRRLRPCTKSQLRWPRSPPTRPGRRLASQASLPSPGLRRCRSTPNPKFVPGSRTDVVWGTERDPAVVAKAREQEPGVTRIELTALGTKSRAAGPQNA